MCWWRYVLVCSALSCAHAAASPADPPKPSEAAAVPLPESATVFLGCGFLLAENHGPSTFSVLLPARVAKQPRKSASVFVLDGVLVQVAVVRASEMGDPQLRGIALLQKQMLWESKYVADAKAWPDVRPSGGPIDLGLGDVKTMLWGFDAPELFEVDGVRMNRMAYVTAAVDDVVLSIASPLRPDDDSRPVARVLFRSMRTLRRERSPVDIFAISAAVQEGKTVPGTCSRVGAP
jgi:hypothetical protein